MLLMRNPECWNLSSARRLDGHWFIMDKRLTRLLRTLMVPSWRTISLAESSLTQRSNCGRSRPMVSRRQISPPTSLCKSRMWAAPCGAGSPRSRGTYRVSDMGDHPRLAHDGGQCHWKRYAIDGLSECADAKLLCTVSTHGLIIPTRAKYTLQEPCIQGIVTRYYAPWLLVGI